MITKPNNYENTSASGDYKELPADGYIVQILKIQESVSKNGNPMLEMAVDICQGDYAGFFQTLWKSRQQNSNNPKEVKYPQDGKAYVVTINADGECSAAFKGFCTALEDSGVKAWSDKDEFLIENIKNARVGLIFCREESENNGKTYWNTKPQYGGFRSVTRIESGDFVVPADKPIETNHMNMNYTSELPDSFSAAEDDIPFA